jgi:all-trans-retinol 13,14-reductase
MRRWLTEGRLRFASLGSPYDIVRLPRFEFLVVAPRVAYIARLKAAFPEETAAIDRYFTACDDAQRASRAVFAAKAAPAPIAALVRWFNAKRIRRALGTTTAEAVRATHDGHLAAVLTAQWGDYGSPPAHSPFGIHALVTGSFFSSAYYPIGAPVRFAEARGETICVAAA